jgi:hypothetical protein
MSLKPLRWEWPTITYHYEDDLVWADSEQVPGWSAWGANEDEVRALYKEAQEDLFTRLGRPKLTLAMSSAAIEEISGVWTPSEPVDIEEMLNG